MQIHELNNFAGTPTSSDYLAIDNSTTTTKIGATGLGVQDKLTVAEANTGTSTASRIVTPKVVHDYVVQDTTHITSATKTKWAGITSGDGSIDNILDYVADKITWKKYSDPTSPVSFGSVSTQTTVLVSANDTLKNASEIIVEIGSSDGTRFFQTQFVNNGHVVYDSYDFLYDSTTTSAVTSSYGAEIEIRVDFTSGQLSGRQTMKKTSGTQFYLHNVYYR